MRQLLKQKMNKKAVEVLMESLIFFILVALFFGAMFYFINRSSKQASILEQIYAKQIALTIDKAKPGTEIILGIEELYEKAEENSYQGFPVQIENVGNKVIVTLVSGRGYEYEFFTGSEVKWNLANNKLELEIV